ncbi:MAG TPA: hypothetical protein VHM91_05120, partial [Verrucomicrobiales bacterium]|nr:hypothetical protein [Verrucomicrobiales bacterium]
AFDPPSFRRGSVDPGFDDVILRALQMDPRRRYAGAQEFRDALVAAYETALLADPGELTGESQAQVLETFYENVISGLPETVRFYVEDKLLTPSGYRDSRALDEALSSPGITRTSLDRLIENRLLRIEERAGVPRVEISHDRLTRVIQASRDARRAKEERRLALERENRLRRQLRFRIMMVLGLSAVLCIVTWGLWQHRVASIKARDESIARAQVRALMDTFSGELLNHLERLGKLSVQDPVFATLDAIFKEYPPSREDPEFLVLRARFLKSQGDSLAVRGRRSAAAGALREALLIFRELNADGAAVECALSAAEALTAQGRAAFAKTELENAAPLMAKLDSGAGSSVLRAQWARQMSRALSGLRQRDHAVEEAGRAVQVLKEIPPGHPGLASGRFNRELALAEADLAEALDETNDLFQGLVHHRMADRLMDDALSADSPDFRWHGEAANIRGALSAALLNSDNKEEGAKVAESALARTTALVSRDPENMPWRRAHAVALEWMGEIRSKEKDYAG